MKPGDKVAAKIIVIGTIREAKPNGTFAVDVDTCTVTLRANDMAPYPGNPPPSHIQTENN